MLIINRTNASKDAELARLRASIQSEINALVSDVRAVHITPMVGQDAVYIAKEAEAIAYLSLDPAPADLSGFPFLAAEVGITAPDPAALANLWLSRAAALRSIAPQIEAIRMEAAYQVETLTDPEALAALPADVAEALSLIS